MRNILLRLASEGKTLIVTSHILPELSRICNKVAIVAGGKLRAFGTLQEVTRELSQLRTIEIQFLTATGLPQIGDKLRKMVEPTAEVTVSQTESIIRCRTSCSDEAMSEVLRQLIIAGDKIAQFREVAGDLEEAFISAARVADAESNGANRVTNATSTAARQTSEAAR